ncbi:MAG: AMP-binding protein, partial [Desulfamplus sp.]|nr:AMP-binding protein [Desulfamplus sp.]
VAGKAQYMDAIDGGAWQYNDASYPKVNRTVFGGTFCQHPTAMITTLATLRHLKDQGPKLQMELNRKTRFLADELNSFFKEEEIPIEVVYFGSLFRFAFSTNLELLFYHLMVKGVFIWEWRNYFLCTAHTEADIAHIIRAVKESVMEMRKGGFLPEKANSSIEGKGSSIEKTDSTLEDKVSAPEKSPLHAGKNALTPESDDKKKTDFAGNLLVPLTKAQRQLAVLALITPEGSKAYHVSPLLSIKGSLDIKSFESALVQLIERHESLRSVIDGDYQKVLSVQALQSSGFLNLVDMTNEKDPVSAEKEWFADYAHKGFNLETGPLFEVNLIKIPDDEFRLVFKGHHIIVDGLSMNIIINELAILYNIHCRTGNSEAKKRISPLPPALPWHEYAQWQNSSSFKNLPSFQKQEKYWLSQLQGDLPVTQLPADHLEPPIKSYRGGRYTLIIPSQLAGTLSALGRSRGCTDFMVLFAAYALWLHRLSAQDDIIAGMPVAGRGIPKRQAVAGEKNNPDSNSLNSDNGTNRGEIMVGGDSVVGYCTHLLPIRSRINWEQTFAQYLKSFRSVLLNGYQNQDYPFAELMDKINLQRDGQRSPLVSVLFNLDRPGDPPEMDGLAIQWLSQPIYYTAFDITLNLTMVDSSIVLECDFNLDRFEQSSIERYTNHFITLLDGIAQNPDASVASLGLLDADEKKKILIEWNDTYADYPSDKCMHQLFEEQAQINPDAVALRSGDCLKSLNGDAVNSGGMMSYRKLNEMANRIAHGLIELGTKTEDVIGIYMHHSVELVAGFLGILKAGAAYLPLDPSYPPKRLAFMLEDAGVRILLTHPPLLASVPETSGIKTVVINGDATVFKEKSTDNPEVAVTPQNLAYLIYTSGSTGLPKGTMIIHKGFVNYLTWAVKYYRVAEGEGSPLHSSIGFDATITSIFTPLISGRCLWLFAADNMENSIGNKGQELENIHSALMSGTNWSLMKFTPAHLELVNAMIDPDKLAGLTRCLVFGGEALLGRQVEPWRKNAPGTRLVNEYGPTETVVGCCIYEVEAVNSDSTLAGSDSGLKNADP